MNRLYSIYNATALVAADDTGAGKKLTTALNVLPNWSLTDPAMPVVQLFFSGVYAVVFMFGLLWSLVGLGKLAIAGGNDIKRKNALGTLKTGAILIAIILFLRVIVNLVSTVAKSV